MNGRRVAKQPEKVELYSAKENDNKINKYDEIP
jgi:hypothetical protein